MIQIHSKLRTITIEEEDKDDEIDKALCVVMYLQAKGFSPWVSDETIIGFKGD